MGLTLILPKRLAWKGRHLGSKKPEVCLQMAGAQRKTLRQPVRGKMTLLVPRKWVARDSSAERWWGRLALANL